MYVCVLTFPPQLSRLAASFAECFFWFADCTTYSSRISELFRPYVFSAPCNGQLLPSREPGSKGSLVFAGVRSEKGVGVRLKKLLFSATLSGDARYLGDLQLRDPLFLTAGEGEGLKMPNELRE
jgi:hypothetical protein